MRNEDDLLVLIPVEDYVAPNLPTLEENRPELLKKIPSRWKKKAVIAVAVGFLGTTALTGCSVARVDDVSSESMNYCSHPHHGGAGFAPLYVVCLTEQEALGIIRLQLEAVGLNFDRPSQVYSVEVGFRETAQFVLINEDEDLRIVLVDPDWLFWRNLNLQTFDFRENVRENFEEIYGIHMDGVFFNPAAGFNPVEGVDSLEKVEEFREEFEASLLEQVDYFIHQLREDEIIE